ncbi:hypothetical protein SDRG_15517 [Saprolegnia diclina VS20]|uniref:Uncharacterized protein n=1 Tax=Saprolegnia diclina (strain VS20) TaxID=1156394 RepID=T0PMN7_SAPDV|nr:hypothetical protein SDRG_15517 [Saprolegnia diclina VS20]EQC26679.1 hypothetical protein SDRG_15517 [Saprolegnia diclina VS20]|eukprot:XP_008619914.1 hypothetical protein SDRG_15517 [Saprolegnia diclina VS20]
MSPRCFADDEANDTVACAVQHWDDCGYGWLRLAPILLCWCLWVLLGVGMLRRHAALHGVFRSDAARVHDPITQGIAIALSQRKYRSVRQQRFQRAVRLLAMWVEAAEFLLAPLELAFRITGHLHALETIDSSIPWAGEAGNVVLAFSSGTVMLVLHPFPSCTFTAA